MYYFINTDNILCSTLVTITKNLNIHIKIE